MIILKTLAIEWRLSETKRRAKYYSLTTAGRKKLEQETRKWKMQTAGISRILLEGGHA